MVTEKVFKYSLDNLAKIDSDSNEKGKKNQGDHFYEGSNRAWKERNTAYTSAVAHRSMRELVKKQKEAKSKKKKSKNKKSK
jgi:hypothetical protein